MIRLAAFSSCVMFCPGMGRQGICELVCSHSSMTASSPSLQSLLQQDLPSFSSGPLYCWSAVYSDLNVLTLLIHLEHSSLKTQLRSYLLSEAFTHTCTHTCHTYHTHEHLHIPHTHAPITHSNTHPHTHTSHSPTTIAKLDTLSSVLAVQVDIPLLLHISYILNNNFLIIIFKNN